jgi:hypothetical protein
MKLCRDCRWALDRGASAITHQPYDWVCTHPAAVHVPPIDYVTGQPQDPRKIDCPTMRQNLSLCGPEGRYWEPRE